MKIGIIGGGTLGLTLAHKLVKAGHCPTVFESASQVGGLATWFDYGGFVWDKYYHVLLDRDEHLLGLIKELKIESMLHWAETKTGFLWRGKHISMSNNREFLSFPALSFVGKVRMALGILYIQRISDPTRLERMNVVDWMRGIFGRKVYEAIWEPLLESKYGSLKNEMPATIMWATIRRYYSTRSKGSGKEKMGYLDEGFKSIYDALLKSIRTNGGEVICNTIITKIEESEAGVKIATTDSSYEFDRVICTTPSRIVEKLAPEIKELHTQAENKPKFLGVICMSLILKRELNPFYVTNLIDKGLPFTGIIGVSNLTGMEKLNNNSLVMLPRYEQPDSEWFSKSDEQIAEEFLNALKKIYPDITENTVRWFVHREKLVQAIWVNEPPASSKPAVSNSGQVWKINAELAGRDTLNNNAIIKVATEAGREFLAAINSEQTNQQQNAENLTADTITECA